MSKEQIFCVRGLICKNSTEAACLKRKKKGLPWVTAALHVTLTLLIVLLCWKCGASS